MRCLECDKKDYIIKNLNSIGIALSAEKNVDRLLDIILEESMKLTDSDAGSVYIKEIKENQEKLTFKLSKNNSREFPFEKFSIPLDSNSISGYVACKGRILVLNDVRNIPETFTFKYNDAFDKIISYKTVSMLNIPMKDYEGNVVGVIQLINKKKDYNIKLQKVEDIEECLTPYTKFDEELVYSLASQASILLQRTKLFEDIEKLLESVIETMVATIDARDATTSGHSKRLSDYAVSLAKTINKVDYGKFKDFKFTEDEIKEINYAALLHDIGKISISEKVLLKGNKLSNERIEAISFRFKYIKKELELKKKLNKINKIELKLYDNLDGYLSKILEVNAKGFLPDQDEMIIKEIYNTPKITIDGSPVTLLEDFERDNLLIKRGTITDEERDIMNSHVESTKQILSRINWPEKLKNVPEFASQHHEKINGKGYPDGILGDDVLLQSRMLAIIDIFEALTARDRPYKKALTAEKAIEIIKNDVKAGALDGNIFEVFEKEKVYEEYM